MNKYLTEFIAPAFLAEFLFTFALAYVVLTVATAIGMTVMTGAFAFDGFRAARSIRRWRWARP